MFNFTQFPAHPGLSRSVIVTDAVTGRRQTYSTGSDVLAQQFAVRVSGRASRVCFHAHSGWVMFCVSSDSCTRHRRALAFQAPVLFNGCRSGEIFSIDLRQRGRGRDHSWKSSRFRQDSAVTSVRLLQDENYLLAADMLGKVKTTTIERNVMQHESGFNLALFHLLRLSCGTCV